MDPATLQEVRKLPLFENLADDQLDCIEGGEVISLERGDLLITEGVTAKYFFVSIEGEIGLFRIYDKQEILMGVSRPGGYMGEMALLLEIPSMATARAATASRLFRLDREHFFRMMSNCHSIAREILRTAATRLRNIEGYSQQREKLASLGTMAAGLAHELNNPAAAARRASASLAKVTVDLQHHVCSLTCVLSPDHWQGLLNSGDDAIESAAKVPTLSSIVRSDREEALSSWLTQQGIRDGWKLAPTFVKAGLDKTWLDQLLSKLPPAGRVHSLQWLESRLVLNSLLSEIDQSTFRISELVKSVKSYSYMDQSPTQEVDIHEGIESTLTMLGHKLKNMTVVRQFAPDLPRITAFGSELNQVWTNLIDNAVDAVKGSGQLEIKTRLDDLHIIVEIIDNGPGIPVDVQKRMFEPFFTTKGVGSGTGLGLVISHRIVADRHGGEIEFDSKPGHTRFCVRIPVTPKKAG